MTSKGVISVRLSAKLKGNPKMAAGVHSAETKAKIGAKSKGKVWSEYSGLS